MKGWIEIFRTGKHTSAEGHTREWTEADLNKMVDGYKPESHEAPLVVGHPKENAPAWGWVEGLKNSNGSLLMKTSQVDPAFAEMVKQGRFKKRSISVYPGGGLRHVGFLGAQPPAIKGLRDIAFSDDGAETYEFVEQSGSDADSHDDKQKKQEADMPTVEELQKQLAAEKKARIASDAKAKEYKEKAEESDSDFAEHKVAAQKKGIVDFVEAGITSGKILPAWKEKGLVTFMQGLDSQVETYEFAEGKKETAGAWFKDFLNTFSEHPLFKEMVKPEGDGNRADAEFAEEEKAAEEMASAHHIDK